jgi:multiple sugar transport system substrate-binding protein
LESWLPLIEALDAAHPEWILVTDQTPQASRTEKLNANLAAGTLPDVQIMSGLDFNPFVQRGAFIPLDDLIAANAVDMDDFFPHIMEEWTWDGQIWGIPNVAAPNVLFFNLNMFEAAGVEVPEGDITFDQLRELAIALTLDGEGRNPTDSEFDPENIVQWGYSNHPGSIGFWASDFVRPWGGDFCANPDCHQISTTDPEDIEALNYWYDLVVTNLAAPADVFGGASTGVPGDPFVGEFAAIGSSGYFLIGQIAASGQFPIAVREMPLGPQGRATVFSSNGYAVAANAPYPEEAFKLILELTSTDFLANMWALPGHSVPARRSAAQAILELSDTLGDLTPVLNSMEYGAGFRPAVPGAFEAFFATMDFGAAVFRGEMTVEEGYTQMQDTANPILAANNP